MPLWPRCAVIYLIPYTGLEHIKNYVAGLTSYSAAFGHAHVVWLSKFYLYSQAERRDLSKEFSELEIAKTREEGEKKKPKARRIGLIKNPRRQGMP